MTNANLQDAVDALGNSKLTGDTVYVLQPSHMRNLTPKAQEGFIQSIVSQLALEGRELDYTFITPLRDAIAKRRSGKRGRLCPSAVMEPVSFKEIRSDSSNRNMAVLGRNVYNELTQSYQHENRVDQIGFRYPGDSHYSVLVSLERNYTSSQNFTLTYHVTYLAASCLHKKDRARSVIRGEHAKFTYSYKSPGAAIDAVYAAPRVSPHAVARTIAWNNRHVLGRMQQYFSEKLHYARSDLMDKLRERDKQSALVHTIVKV